MIKVLILDDHPLVRQGIRMVVASAHKISIVGEASSSQEALEIMSEIEPNLILVDLNLGKDSGLDFIKLAKSLEYSCKFLIITSSATHNEIKLAQELGVEGICLKEALPEDLLYAISAVARGRKFYDPIFMESLMEASPAAEKLTYAELTPKEIEVLIKLGKGLSNKEIASELFITEFTVKKHVSQILSKLNLADRTQAALYALSQGLVKYSNH